MRVYVTRDGKPGVWFLSLDATRLPAVVAARQLFHLPYHWADIDITETSEGFDYRCRRRNPLPGGERGRSPSLGEEIGEGRPSLAAHYRPATTPVYAATPGTLEHWLTERYSLYAVTPDGALFRTEVHHHPWPLQQATAEFTANTISAAGGLPVSGPPALLHFARRNRCGHLGAGASGR